MPKQAPGEGREKNVMQRKTGVIVVTHGSQLAAGNDVLGQMTERLRVRLGTNLIEPCFMELGDQSIPVAIERLIAHGCNHIFACAFFFLPGKHLQEDVPAIIEEALRGHQGVTYEITGPMLDDPDLFELVAKRLEGALHPPRRP
jgi:sirohydrochlorin ferrochelatase